MGLAGCAGADYSPLQRDLQELASLPGRFDAFVKERTAQSKQYPAHTATEHVQQTTTTEQVAVAAAVPDLIPAIVPEAQVRAKPAGSNFLEHLKRAIVAPAQQANAEPISPGAHDLIPEPIPVENPLARPPWEVFVEAGPNAHNELDLETLYGPGNIPAELQAEQEQSPTPEQQIAVAQSNIPAIDATAEPEKPSASVVIKAVAVPSVKGAPGTGNAELTMAMRQALKQAGWPVLSAPRKDALTIQGRVALGKAKGSEQSVTIMWDVLSPEGQKLGNLQQDNAVAAGSLDETWSDNARYAAEAAAEGIFKLIQKYR